MRTVGVALGPAGCSLAASHCVMVPPSWAETGWLLPSFQCPRLFSSSATGTPFQARVRGGPHLDSKQSPSAPQKSSPVGPLLELLILKFVFFFGGVLPC